MGQKNKIIMRKFFLLAAALLGSAAANAQDDAKNQSSEDEFSLKFEDINWFCYYTDRPDTVTSTDVYIATPYTADGAKLQSMVINGNITLNQLIAHYFEVDLRYSTKMFSSSDMPQPGTNLYFDAYTGGRGHDGNFVKFGRLASGDGSAYSDFDSLWEGVFMGRAKGTCRASANIRYDIDYVDPYPYTIPDEN